MRGFFSFKFFKCRKRDYILSCIYNYVNILFPSSVEVLGMFRSFCSAPFSIVPLNTLKTPIFTRKIFALSGLFFIEKIFGICYNNSTL